MYYPMRVIRTSRYKLMHNLAALMPFPIDQDFYLSPTWQDILQRTRAHKPLHWFSTLRDYYYRPQWQLFDLNKDPHEMQNLYSDPTYAKIISQLRGQLTAWQNVTDDPWICAPTAVLEKGGIYKQHPQCMALDNGLDDL